MRTAISILSIAGLLFFAFAKYLDGRVKSPDDWSPDAMAIIGVICWCWAVLVTIGWGIYRMFST